MALAWLPRACGAIGSLWRITVDRQREREREREGGRQGGREGEEGKRRVRKKRLDVRDRFLEATYKSVFKGCCSFLFFVVGLIALE